ncbi:hypothetical protein K431DRAFT_79736 [Polychaeton citri CBS 116435]|uniref:Uncharacterized protein n=1 Tax=Polychaeton citri CBS 116435 TaxID=1314669 RepID=A0A9P4UUW1_9PEZI|nr:hypothetical protein K431DRAFT_79736 [Polychaeton citri CBS 116435]
MYLHPQSRQSNGDLAHSGMVARPLQGPSQPQRPGHSSGEPHGRVRGPLLPQIPYITRVGRLSLCSSGWNETRPPPRLSKVFAFFLLHGLLNCTAILLPSCHPVASHFAFQLAQRQVFPIHCRSPLAVSAYYY